MINLFLLTVNSQRDVELVPLFSYQFKIRLEKFCRRVSRLQNFCLRHATANAKLKIKNQDRTSI